MSALGSLEIGHALIGEKVSQEILIRFKTVETLSSCQQSFVGLFVALPNTSTPNRFPPRPYPARTHEDQFPLFSHLRNVRHCESARDSTPERRF